MPRQSDVRNCRPERMFTMNKKVLVLGSTGAMGRYVVPQLLNFGYEVDGVSLERGISDNPKLKCITGNTKDDGFLDEILKNGYNGIIDFMSYTVNEFESVYKKFLDNTDHYIFLSTCRVYADNPPITEQSPRLLDTSGDYEFLATEDYALFKAKEENMLINSKYSNWTIVRPATTFSTGRFQLVTLEAPTLIYRMQAKKIVVLPKEAMNCQATLSWGGDVGKMIARLLFNTYAEREIYNVCTSEHHSWSEIAGMYNRICPFRYITVDKDDYLEIIENHAPWAVYQLIYARMFQRITDNTKILNAAGMKQSELMPLEKGLNFEYKNSKSIDYTIFKNDHRNVNMDEYLAKHNIF